jgi:acyl carrier protein
VPEDVSTYVRGSILECLSRTLKIPANSIETDIAFSDYGIDSILGVNFINQINEWFGISLNTAIIFEYSSIERLSRHIVETYGGQIDAARPSGAQSDEIGEMFEDEPQVFAARPQAIEPSRPAGAR